MGGIVVGKGDQDGHRDRQEHDEDRDKGRGRRGKEGETFPSDGGLRFEPVIFSHPLNHACFYSPDIAIGLVEDQKSHQQQDNRDDAFHHENDGAIET